MTEQPTEIDIQVRSGIRTDIDEDGAGVYAAVSIEVGGFDGEGILNAAEATDLGIRLICGAARDPGAVFTVDQLPLPPGATGMTADSARVLGIQILAAGLIAPYELAIWQALGESGAPEQVRSIFLHGIKDRVEKGRS